MDISVLPPAHLQRLVVCDDYNRTDRAITPNILPQLRLHMPVFPCPTCPYPPPSLPYLACPTFQNRAANSVKPEKGIQMYI
jgi:hypothetical protein